MRDKITEIFRKIKKDPYMCAGVMITGMILLMIIVGLFWMPYEPTKMNASEKLKGISFKHIMGTDNMGRDVFSRVMYGSRVTFLIALGTVFIGAFMGTLIDGQDEKSRSGSLCKVRLCLP